MPLNQFIRSYTVRNRVLRYIKRYRTTRPLLLQYFSLSNVLVIFFVLSLCLFWWIITRANEVFNEANRINQTAWNNDQHELSKINNESELREKEKGFEEHAFNTVVSRRIGLWRPLPDTRHQLCQNLTYQSNLSSFNTSVIIIFYNEDYHTLLRTVYSVLEQTPDELLHEILLMDDNSLNFVGIRLHNYMSNLKIKSEQTKNEQRYLQKVHYHRLPERSGLIRARIYGAKRATGKVLTFLDSHCEANVNWLPPLLSRIAQNRKTVVCPCIDVIDPDTFKYTASPIVKGGFNWGLHFLWKSVPSEELKTPDDYVKPIKSPTMAGGLFAIERKYFFELGAYDDGMDIWGGENIEISFRIWMCGGQLEIIPCSRIGHVFRKRRPYGSPIGRDTLAYNSIRVARVWMDDYQKYFFETRRDLREMPHGDISKRIELRQKLNCTTFEWYLKNIEPTLLTPEEEALKNKTAKAAEKLSLFSRKPKKIVDKFRLQLADTDLCLYTDLEVTYKKSKLLLDTCTAYQRRQSWKETEIGDIRLGPKVCLEAIQGKDSVRLTKCHEMNGTQKWTHKSKTKTQLYNEGSGLCLAILGPYSKFQLQNRVNQPVQVDLLQVTMHLCTPQNSSNHDFHVFTLWNLT